MPAPIRWVPLAASLLLATTLACAPRSPIRAERAWVRAVPRGATTAAYFTLVNDTGRGLELIGAGTAAADTTQMHESRREEGRVTMRPVASLELAPHARLEFRPGGNHLMLIGVHSDLAAGARVDLVLFLHDGGQVPVRAEVRS